MNLKKLTALVLALVMALTLFGCGKQQNDVQQDDPKQPETVTVTDMIGRQVTVTPGSYQRVVCIGAGALRMYSYIADTALLCGVEDIDNTTLAERPKMFDAVARPYVLAYGDVFAALPSCGVGGPTAQAAEAEKILSCQPDIIVSEYEDVEKADALQQQVGVPVITLRAGADGVFAEAFPGSLRLLGQVFDRADRAEELITFIETETAEITRRTADVAEADRPGVYVCGLGNWGTTNRPELCRLPCSQHPQRGHRPCHRRHPAHRGGEVRRAGRQHGSHAHRRRSSEEHHPPLRGGSHHAGYLQGVAGRQRLSGDGLQRLLHQL